MKSEEELLEIFMWNSENFYSLCRLCLSKTANNGKSLSTKDELATIAQKVTIYTEIVLKEDDGLPNSICEECYQKLNTLDCFKNMCQQSNNLLTKLYLDVIVKTKSASSTLVLESNEKDEASGNDEMQDSPESEDTLTMYEQAEGIMIPSMIKNELHKDIISEMKEMSKNGNDIFTCDICHKQLRHKKSLDNHLRKVHSEKKKKIDVGVISGYGAERQYHCTECDYATKYKIDLIIHTRRHTGEKPYKCDKCEKCFAQQSTLNNHLKTHSDIMYFTCPHCGKQFKYKYKFEKHKNSHTQQQLYYCTLCNRGLKSPKILEEHMNRHLNIKNFNCETCGSTFVTFSEMSIHSRIHGTEKKFKCHLCEYKTFVKASLEKHVRRHTGERPFICEICQWKCYTQGELKVHTRTHTKEKNYVCPMCITSFKTSSALNKHVSRIHGIKYKWSDHKDRRIIK